MTELNKIEFKQVRTKRALMRYSDNGDYNKKPLDPNYFNDYYQAHKEPTDCTHCNKTYTCRAGLAKHLIRSNVCKRIRASTIEIPTV